VIFLRDFLAYVNLIAIGKADLEHLTGREDSLEDLIARNILNIPDGRVLNFALFAVLGLLGNFKSTEYGKTRGPRLLKRATVLHLSLFFMYRLFACKRYVITRGSLLTLESLCLRLLTR